jgi:nucleoside-diphosphate-sugar epimerase|tara:strand:- start:671 stop:1729 length:1059 start_codon:yes stop_codon:yes gene_type:complete
MNHSKENFIISEDIDYLLSQKLDWNTLTNKTILISGGSGFLASYLIKTLLRASEQMDLGLKVICLVRNMNKLSRLSGLEKGKNFLLIKHDITQPLSESLKRSDYVIHAASNASPKYYGIDPVGTLLANTAGCQYMLDYSVRSKAEKFLFFSSSEVYGEPADQNKFLTEEDFGYLDPMKVRSCYAESKRLGETMCASWSSQFGLNTTVVRPFHTYGPGMYLDDGRVFADFVSNIVDSKNIILKSDGSSVRAFCYIRDATEGLIQILLKGKSGEAYNLGNPSQETSMKDLALMLCNVFPERKLSLEFSKEANTNSYIKSKVNRSVPNITKLQALGWSPCIDLREGFKRTVMSYE